MADQDLEPTLTEEWQAFVASIQPDRQLAVTTTAARGNRVTRPMIWADLEDVRLAIAEIHAAVTPGRAGALATTRWTVKDVVAHLASWAAEFRRQVETVAHRGAFDYLITFTPNVGPTAWNEQELARRRGVSIDACVQEFSHETARIQELALTLPDDVLFGVAELPQTSDGRPEHRWRARIADLMLMKCWHDRHHMERLCEVLDVKVD